MDLAMSSATLLAEVLAVGIYVGVTQPILTVVTDKHFDGTNAGLEKTVADVWRC